MPVVINFHQSIVTHSWFSGIDTFRSKSAFIVRDLPVGHDISKMPIKLIRALVSSENTFVFALLKTEYLRILKYLKVYIYNFPKCISYQTLASFPKSQHDTSVRTVSSYCLSSVHSGHQVRRANKTTLSQELQHFFW